jgi:hypothetical protein
LNHSARIVWTINNSTGTYNIPWGVSATEYIPLTYQLTGGSVGTVSFSTYRTPASNQPWPPGITNLTSNIGLSPDNRTATVDRFWRMSHTGTAPVLNLTFNYVASEIPGIPFNIPSQMRAHSYNLATNNWMAAVPGQSATPYQVITPNAGANGNWAISSLAAPLPVEWLYVKAYAVGSFAARIEWSTASETNNDFFTVWEIMPDGSELPLGKLTAAGNSTEINKYQLEVPVYGQRVHYYKVSQTDFDGSTTWSGIISFTPLLQSGGQCWADHETQTLQVRTGVSGVSSLTLTDVSGRTLFNERFTGPDFHVPQMNWAKGQVLFVIVENEAGRFVTKLYY